MDKALLIDIGSTNIKWAKTNLDGFVYDIHKCPFPEKLLFPKPYFEVDINRIIDILKNIVDENSDCNELYVSVQMHGYLLTDRNHFPVTNYISWRDQRAKNLNLLDNLEKASGTSLKNNTPRVSVLAIKNFQKGIYRYSKHLFTLGSYLAYCLTNKIGIHITDACPTGYYSVITKKSIESEISLPKAYGNVKVLGKYNNIKVYLPVGDQQASIKALNHSESSYILNLGTACQICCIEDKYVEGNFETRPYFNQKFLCTKTELLGGLYINNYQRDDLEEKLYKNYKAALLDLPKRETLIATGGVLDFHLHLLERVLKRLAIPYRIDKSNALDGLSKLAKENRNE